MTLLTMLGIDLPIIQAPMAGTATPAMAAAASNAGALGSIAVGATNPTGARAMLVDTRARTSRSLNVNVFCHQPASVDAAVEAAWLAHLDPHFSKFGARPPERLREIYQSFVTDDSMMAELIAARPKVVSFHFGLPSADCIRALRDAGIVLIATATSVTEGQAAASAGMNAVIAQGYEAGGHRGVFDPDAHDDCLGTLALTRLLARNLAVPIIAAGGIMDGAGIVAALKLGASAAQLGTAFIACPESGADSAYRATLSSDAAYHTTMTRAISGRPARCLQNDFTRLGVDASALRIPGYPHAYDAGKALNAAAKAKGVSTYGAQWAGQGAPLARSMPAAQLIAALANEMS